jgi:hypothetical protein
LAKANIITKIAGKINKGYYSTTAEKIPEIPNDKKPVRRKKAS